MTMSLGRHCERSEAIQICAAVSKQSLRDCRLDCRAALRLAMTMLLGWIAAPLRGSQ
jgi:hypothetical protein